MPQISNLKASIVPGENKLLIRYDVKSANENALSIRFKLIDADNQSSEIECTAIHGDVGYPVTAGAGKIISCNYVGPINKGGKYKVIVTAENPQHYSISDVIERVNIANLKKDLSLLSVKRYFQEDSIQKVNLVTKIEADFAASNIKLQKQIFSYKGYGAVNLVGVLPGMSDNDSMIIVGAHWDAVKGSPGADDNASGIAGMLEIMRVLSKYKLKHSVCFIAFDMEEEGLQGSREFVTQLDSIKASRIQLVINLDMIGYYSHEPKTQVFPSALKGLFPEAYEVVSNDQFRGNFILNTMNENSANAGSLFDSCVHLYVPGLKVVSLVVPEDGKFAPDAFRASDHTSFWDANMKAVSIGDTGDLRNYNYHSATDTVEEVDLPFMANVVKALTATVAKMGGIINAVTVETCVDF